MGLTAEGTVPDLQRRTLVELAEWNRANGPSVFGSTPVAAELAEPGETPWVRWTRTGDRLHAFLWTTESAPALTADAARVDPESARFADGTRASVRITGEGLAVDMPARGASVPVQVTFDLRSA
jgi:alpha-L-fucosidase